MTIKVFRKTNKWGVLKLTFDLEGFTLYQSRYWRIKKDTQTFYLYCEIKKRMYSMHRILLNLQDDRSKIVDHINHDGLDNRAENLRPCTHSQNQANQRHQTRYKTSKYKGVSYSKTRKKWLAQIGSNKFKIRLGAFLSEKEAAAAYNTKAIELYGEFAYINNLDL